MAVTARALPIPRAVYLEREAVALERHAFHEGEVLAMAGGSTVHAVLAANVGAALHGALRSSPCATASPDLRVQIDAANLTYADAAVICPPVAMPPDDPHAVLNPTLLVEVLSPCTAAWDRGGKFALYRRIASLEHYLVVSQDCWRVEHFRRMNDGSWRLTEHGPGGQVELDALGAALRVDDVYAKVELVGGPGREVVQPGRP